jgi:hypothetical protein
MWFGGLLWLRIPNAVSRIRIPEAVRFQLSTAELARVQHDIWHY